MDAYRLTQLNESKAFFEKIGQYEPSMLENIFGESENDHAQLQNGLLYFTQGNFAGPANPHVVVLNALDRHPLRLIAHFAAPGVQTVCPLPDGTAIVGGDKLWLIGPPPHK